MSAASLPRRFGRYALFDFVGKGGMAEIYLARAETEFGGSRLCVVKEILPELGGDPSYADMLVREAKLAARLDHANIVQVFDLGRAEDRLYIAMEYVEGYDLNALLRELTVRKLRLPLVHALHIVSEVLRGLSFAHRAVGDDDQPLSIVHRDVSPSNILISLDGEVKLCDFGIAKANEGLGSRDGALGEALRGKAGYMSPEHARGEALDARADVFAAGIVLWELLSGRRMYRASNGEPLIELARRAEIPALAPSLELPKELELRALLSRALEVDRAQRFESAAQMARALDDYLLSAELTPNPLLLGQWLREQVGSAAIERRRARERALSADGTTLEDSVQDAQGSAADEPAQASQDAAADESAQETPQPVRIAVEVPPMRLPAPSYGALRSFVRELEEEPLPSTRSPSELQSEQERSPRWLAALVLLALLALLAYLALRS